MVRKKGSYETDCIKGSSIWDNRMAMGRVIGMLSGCLEDHGITSCKSNGHLSSNKEDCLRIGFC